MTGKYRRRVVEVEAWQNDDAGPAMPYWLEQIARREKAGLIVISIGGGRNLVAQLGDYAVLYPDGHVAVMDPGAFGVEFEEAPQLRVATIPALTLDGKPLRSAGIDYGLPERMLDHAIDKSDDRHG